MTSRSKSGGEAPGERPEPDSQRGIMEGLPRTRPGIRSPRRDAAAKRGPRARGGGSETARGSGRERARSGGAERPGLGTDLPAAIEGVARAGMSAAAGAATFGARLAGRAASTIRDAVERR